MWLTSSVELLLCWPGHKFYEVILLDPARKVVRRNPDTQWIQNRCKNIVSNVDLLLLDVKAVDLVIMPKQLEVLNSIESVDRRKEGLEFKIFFYCVFIINDKC
ncbi:hypothetical protein ACQ4LE_009346 [Meloidogyne hapla]